VCAGSGRRRSILEENALCVRTMKARHSGYIVYEDECQVVAEPFADLAM
jgi:hypothetical protein